MFRCFLLCFSAILLVSCGNGKGKAEAENSDQLPDSAEIELPKIVERLPDTMYHSAKSVWYKIDEADTAVSGKLNSLQNLYCSSSTFTFRKGEMRQADFGGRLDSVPTRFRVDWKVITENDTTDTVFGPWGGGTGWTGQPLYVEWPDTLVKKLKNAGAVLPAFNKNEIMVGSLCGKVYFLNPADGKFTREPIAVGNPIKGTPSVDPTLNGNLYVGQGVPGRRPFGAVAIDLFTNEIFDFFKEDPKALRRWGAYDSSPVRVGQFLFRPGENGSVYKFVAQPAKLSLHSVLRYTVNGAAPGIESSMAVYANYGFVADNHGNVLAINLDTMVPVWHYSLGDDTDATPVVAVEDGVPYLYVGCEIDRQQRGHAVFAKLRAVDGTEVWKIEPEGFRFDKDKKHFDGGFYATPLLGSGNCENIIFANMVKNTRGQNGVFMAINRADGNIVYEIPLKSYAWSSPVGFVTPQGKMLVATGDCVGNLYLIDGEKGEILFSERIGGNFESSPLVIGNSLVVGSRGNGIYKVTLE